MNPVAAGHNLYAMARQREVLASIKPGQLSFPRKVQDRIFDLYKALKMAEVAAKGTRSKPVHDRVRALEQELQQIGEKRGLTLPQLLTVVEASLDG